MVQWTGFSAGRREANQPVFNHPQLGSGLAFGPLDVPTIIAVDWLTDTKLVPRPKWQQRLSWLWWPWRRDRVVQVPSVPDMEALRRFIAERGVGYVVVDYSILRQRRNVFAGHFTTDGRRVFAVFANGDVAAFDFQGKPAWARSLGIPENSYGHASSPAMFENRLLVQLDQASKKDRKSVFLALSAVDGKTLWRVGRDVPNSWTSPIVIRHAGRDQIITAADPWVIAYNPADGAELWRASVLRGDCGPSPIFAGGLVHVGNEYCYWSAIRPDGDGDVTETHIAWNAEDGLPDTCSPLATDKYVFLLATYGTLTCYDAKKGELLWEQDFDARFISSPGLSGNRVYLFGEVEEEDEEGNELTTCTAWIIEPGREGCKIVGTCELDEGCVTSPAFQDGRIYIRGKKHLFCIGNK